MAMVKLMNNVDSTYCLFQPCQWKTCKRKNMWAKTIISFMDDIIILLNFIFTGLQGYEVTPGLSTNKQRHHLLLLKTGIHVARTYL